MKTMNENRIFSFVEWTLLFFMWGLIFSFCFAGNARAGEDGWLVRQKSPSASGQWILFENGTAELIPLPPGLENKDLNPSRVPPGFDDGRKTGWEKAKGEAPRTPPGFVDTRVYGDGTPRTPPGFVDDRVYGDGKPRTPPGFVDTRVYGDGTPRTPPGFVDTRVYGEDDSRRKPEKLDPYGKSKDDRLEVCGNRGRPIRDCELGKEEPAPDQLYTDSWTFWALKYAADSGINPYFWLIELSGYSPLEAQFLMEHTMEQVYDAYSVTGEEDFLKGLLLENASWDLQTENLIADFETYGSLVPAVPLTEEEKAAIIAYADPYHTSVSAGFLRGFDDPRSIYRSDYEIDAVFSVNTVDSKTVG